MSLSDRWLQNFLRDQLGWSYRTATKASRKRPADWEHQGLLAFLRMVKIISQYGGKSARMIVNADQTGISLFPTGNKTWEIRGSKQVITPNHDEKRQVCPLTLRSHLPLINSTFQFTVVVASSCAGDILPFQSVWGGSTNASLPKATASRWTEANANGFTYAHGDIRHWSSTETTKEVSRSNTGTKSRLTIPVQWVGTTLIPYLDRVRAEENLAPDSPAILFIDAWPIHTAKSKPDCFLPWILSTHPEIKIVFVPAGCRCPFKTCLQHLTELAGTGEFQPADVLLQRIVKHIIKQAALDFFVASSTRQLNAGISAECVKIPNDLPTLRDASVVWTLEAFLYLKDRPEVVAKAWEKCKTGEWDFSWAKLTSSEATKCLYATLSSNEAFRQELSISGPILPQTSRKKSQQVHSGEEILDEAEIEFSNPGDDVSIPITALVQMLTKNSGPDNITTDEDGSLVRFGDEGDIEYENDRSGEANSASGVPMAVGDVMQTTEVNQSDGE